MVSQALVPITQDVEVSYELHRYIIGQKGSGIRKMMEEYEVGWPLVPPAVGKSTGVQLIRVKRTPILNQPAIIYIYWLFYVHYINI